MTRSAMRSRVRSRPLPSRSGSALVTAALTLALGACRQRTELVVGVASNLGTAMDLVRMRVTDGDGRDVIARDWPLGPGSGYRLPGSFGVGARSDKPFVVHVEGYREGARPADGSVAPELRVSRHAQLSFVDGRTLFMRLALTDSCVGKLEGACPAGQWCAEGACRSIALDANGLPDYHDGDESVAQCGDGARLGLTGAGTCSSGFACIDGVCAAAGAVALDGPHPGSGSDGSDDSMPGAMADAALDAGGLDSAMMDASRADAALDSSVAPLDGSAALDGALDANVDASIDSSGAPVDAAVGRDLIAPPDLRATPPPVYPPFHWISPLPQGEPITSLAYDLSNGTSPLWASAAGGSILRLDGAGNLVEESTPLSTGGRALASLAARGGEVWAGADVPASQASASGFVLHRATDGAWSQLLAPDPYQMDSVTSLYAGAHGVYGVGIRTSTQQPQILRVGSTSIAVVDSTPPPWSSGTFVTSIVVEDAAGAPCGLLAGLNGILRRLDATSSLWLSDTRSGAPTALSQDLRAIAGCGGDGTLVAGAITTTHQPAAWRLSGSTWSQTPLPGLVGGAVLALSAVAGNLDDVYALAGDGAGAPHVLHFASGAWSDFGSAPATRLAPSDTGKIVAARDRGGALYLGVSINEKYFDYRQGQWVPRVKNLTLASSLIWSDGAQRVVAPGFTRVGNVQTAHVSYTDDGGVTWKESPLPSGIAYVAQVTGVATGAGTSTVYAVGDDKVLSSSNLAAGFSVVFASGNTTTTMSGVWGADAANVYAVDGARIYSNAGGSWKAVATPAGLAPYCVFGLSATDVYVGGDVAGVPAVFGGNRTGFMPAGQGAASSSGDVLSLWGTVGGDLWGVGSQGVVMRRKRGSTAFLPFPYFTLDRVNAVAGTSSTDVFAVGDYGEVFAFDGTSWRQLDARTAQPSLTGVAVDSHHVWIAGGDDVLLMTR